MKKISISDRILLLITCVMSAYLIAYDFSDLTPLVTWSYTVGFGVLLVACLLLIILGFEGLESQIVVIVSSMIPLSISLGLIAEHLAKYTIPYLVFTVIGFGAISVTRYIVDRKIATFILAMTHGIAGLVITLLPISLSIQGLVSAGYFLVGLGGALIGAGGLLLAFLKTGKPILPRETILTILPGLLLMMTTAFVAGFRLS